jgi:hypothetical protein
MHAQLHLSYITFNDDPLELIDDGFVDEDLSGNDLIVLVVRIVCISQLHLKCQCQREHTTRGRQRMRSLLVHPAAVRIRETRA